MRDGEWRIRNGPDQAHDVLYVMRRVLIFIPRTQEDVLALERKKDTS